MAHYEHTGETDEVWVGIKEISTKTKNPESRVYTLARLPVHEGGLPTFRIGKLHALRRSTYLGWIERQEAGE